MIYNARRSVDLPLRGPRPRFERDRANPADLLELVRQPAQGRRRPIAGSRTTSTGTGSSSPSSGTRRPRSSGSGSSPPLPSHELADVLRQHDIFITATENDAYSNALVEALSCGLPAVYLDSGGSREAVKEAGFGFRDREEIPALPRSARRRVRAAAGLDLAAHARGDRRPVPRDAGAARVHRSAGVEWRLALSAARPARSPAASGPCSPGDGPRTRSSSSSARGPAG